MPLQNRVQPTGNILAIAERGTLMGNRGILHDERQRLSTRRWQHMSWVTCLTKFKDWHREVMQPRHYTELFFLDETTALAAGHRPCALCRRADYTEFKSLFNAANGTDTLTEIDRQMHQDRVTRARAQRRHEAEARELPDGTFILFENRPHLLWQNAMLRYSPAGYTDAHPRHKGTVTVLTPASTVKTLAKGYRPDLHASAARLS